MTGASMGELAARLPNVTEEVKPGPFPERIAKIEGDCRHVLRYADLKPGQSWPHIAPEQTRRGYMIGVGSSPATWICVGCLLDRVARLEDAGRKSPGAPPPLSHRLRLALADRIRELAQRLIPSVP